MQKALIGKKIGMTQIFDANGNVVPVTVVEAGPCSVVMKKTVENDGYEAVQLGFGDVKVQRVNKPMKGHFDKAGTAPKNPSESSDLTISRASTWAISSKPTFSLLVITLTLSVQAKVRAPQAPSRDGTSPDSR